MSLSMGMYFGKRYLNRERLMLMSPSQFAYLSAMRSSLF